jgi:hypothetical protein
MNSSGKKAEQYITDSRTKRPHQPRGGHERVASTSTRPVGRDRISAASSGRPGGRNWVVSR